MSDTAKDQSYQKDNSIVHTGVSTVGIHRKQLKTACEHLYYYYVRMNSTVQYYPILTSIESYHYSTYGTGTFTYPTHHRDVRFTAAQTSDLLIHYSIHVQYQWIQQ